MKDPFSNWKPSRGVAKRIFFRPRPPKQEEPDKAPVDTKRYVERQRLRDPSAKVENSPKQKLSKRASRGFFNRKFRFGKASSPGRESLEPVAKVNDDEELYDEEESIHFAPPEFFVRSPNASGDEKVGHSHLAQKMNSTESRDHEPSPGEEEIDFTETDSDDDEEDFVLPEGFLGRFRENSEPLFSNVRHMLSAIQEEEEGESSTVHSETPTDGGENQGKDDEQSSLMLDSTALTAVSSGVSENDDTDNSIKWIPLLHRNIAYETTSAELGVEISADRESPAGAALKIKLQRQMNVDGLIENDFSAVPEAPLVMNMTPGNFQDAKQNVELEGVDAAVASLDDSSIDSPLDTSTETQNSSRNRLFSKALGSGLGGTTGETDTMLGRAFSCTGDEKEKETSCPGAHSNSATVSGSMNDGSDMYPIAASAYPGENTTLASASGSVGWSRMHSVATSFDPGPGDLSTVMTTSRSVDRSDKSSAAASVDTGPRELSKLGTKSVSVDGMDMDSGVVASSVGTATGLRRRIEALTRLESLLRHTINRRNTTGEEGISSEVAPERSCVVDAKVDEDLPPSTPANEMCMDTYKCKQERKGSSAETHKPCFTDDGKDPQPRPEAVETFRQKEEKTKVQLKVHEIHKGGCPSGHQLDQSTVKLAQSALEADFSHNSGVQFTNKDTLLTGGVNGRNATDSVLDGNEQCESLSAQTRDVELLTPEQLNCTNEVQGSREASVTSQQMAPSGYGSGNDSDCVVSSNIPALHLKMPQTSDEDKGTLELAAKPKLSLGMTKVKRFLSKPVARHENKETKRCRSSGEKRLIPWLMKRDSSFSDTKAEQVATTEKTETSVSALDSCTVERLDDCAAILSVLGNDLAGQSKPISEEIQNVCQKDKTAASLLDAFGGGLQNLKSSAADLGKTFGEILSGEEESSFNHSCTENLKKAGELSAHTLEDVSSVFTEQSATKRHSKVLAQMGTSFRGLFSRKRSKTINRIHTPRQLAPSEVRFIDSRQATIAREKEEGEAVFSSQPSQTKGRYKLLGVQLQDESASEEIEIIYVNKDDPLFSVDHVGLSCLSDKKESHEVAVLPNKENESVDKNLEQTSESRSDGAASSVHPGDMGTQEKERIDIDETPEVLADMREEMADRNPAETKRTDALQDSADSETRTESELTERKLSCAIISRRGGTLREENQSSQSLASIGKSKTKSQHYKKLIHADDTHAPVEPNAG